MHENRKTQTSVTCCLDTAVVWHTSSPSHCQFALPISGPLDSMGKVHLLLWKFTHLDNNADYILENKELRGFLKTTKKSINPKKCSRTFVAYCDRDGDQRISLNEWYTCFGVKGNKL